MKNKKVNKALKTYGLIGKILCGFAGGIVGFVFGGALMAIPGILVGFLGGHLLEKSVVNTSSSPNWR